MYLNVQWKSHALEAKVRRRMAAHANTRTEENDNAAARQHLHNGLLLQTLHLATATLLMV